MSVINDLIDRVNDPDLRARLSEEVARMQKQKKFGLVFEEHLPEATPLYEAAISVGSLVSLKDKEFKEFFRVKQIKRGTLVCEREDDSHERVELNKNDVVAVALFGQPIYPCLKPMDAVKNAPDSDLWHTLIEATTIMLCNFWYICMVVWWIVSILTRPTILAIRVGSTTITMLTTPILSVTASG